MNITIMNKKILTPLYALCLLLGFVACKEDMKYIPAEKPTNAQVYFAYTLPSTVALPADMNTTSFDVALYRIDKENALTVNLTVENEDPDIFTIPTTASFSAGEEMTEITINYDPVKLGYDTYKSVSIIISDTTLTTPYGKSAYIFKAGIPAPWVSLGMAKFTDAFVFENFYDVELQQNTVAPTHFRLVDPYTEGLNNPDEGYTPDQLKGDQSPYLEFQVLPKGFVYTATRTNATTATITTSVDDLIMYGDICTGFYNIANSYNQDIWAYHPSRFASLGDDDSSWKHNVVLQYQENGLPAVVQLAPYYFMPGIGGWNYTQYDGMITIIFPGVVLADYSSDVEYDGRYVNANGDMFAVANVTLGADVAYAKVAIVPGSLTNDDLNGIIDGSIESVQITASGTVNLPCSSAGRYTFVVVTFDSNGEDQDYSSVSFNFTTGDAAVMYPIEDFYGDYIMTGYDYWDDSDMSMPVTIAAGDNPNTLVITGIDFVTNVTATFPVKGYMSIAPQDIPDKFSYQGTSYDEGFYTVLPTGDISDDPADAMIFTRLESGDIVLTPDSYAIGYFIGIDLGGLDSYYNIAFTPASSSKAAVLMAASKAKVSPSSSVLKAKARGVKNSKTFGGRVVLPQKGSVKKALRDLTKTTRIF